VQSERSKKTELRGVHGGERLVMQRARKLLKEGERLRWERRFDEAIEALEKAAQLAESQEGRSQLLAECLSWLGLVHSLRSNDEESLRRAKELHEQALDIETHLHGEVHDRVAETLRLLGGTLAQMGRNEEAFEVFSRSVVMARSLGIRNRSTLDALARLSHVAFDLGRYEEAAAAALEYLSLPLAEPLSALEEMSGHMNAGRALLEAKRASEAIPHFERNLELAQSRGRERGIKEMTEWLTKAKAAAGHS
jgi:tetratricopeptide (TPR) repeat protein